MYLHILHSYTHNFMEKDSAYHMWKLLEKHGVVYNRRPEFLIEWAKYSLQEQRIIYRTIRDKINNKAFVHYYPDAAIRENAPQQPQEEPTNYNGRRLPNKPTGTALYKGKWGTYTLEDIAKFGLKRPD